MCTTSALVISLQFPKPKSFPISRFHFNKKFTSLSRIRKYPFLVMTDIVRNRASAGDQVEVGVGVKIEGFEQEALINGPLTSAGPGGINATLNNLSKWLVAALFGIIFLWRHDAEALWAASGSVLNAGLSTVLKRILNQERPVSTLRSDPGMPSSHAQSIFYTVTFCIVSMVEYFGLNGVTAVISALIFAIGSYFSWLRVSQQLHTTSQVAVGAVLGISFSFFWFWLWNVIVFKAFVTHLWVRLICVLGTAATCVTFLLYVIRYWLLEEN